MKWIKKNWIPIAFAILIIILLVDKSCDDSAFKKNIAVLDKDVTELEGKNVILEEEVVEYVLGAIADQEIVAKLKTAIDESKLRIEELEKEESEIIEKIMELSPSKLVEDTREILGCGNILLNKEGILFSIECAREGLLKLKRFSLVEGKFDEVILALSISEKALQGQEKISWQLFGALWKMGDQILNYKVIVKKKDKKYDLSEKHRKKSFWHGLKIGLVIGAGITITIVIIIPLIRWIF